MLCVSGTNLGPQALGLLGEKIVLAECQQAGLSARRTMGADITTRDGIKIEVKSSRLSREGVQVCLRNGRTDISHADVLVILGFVANIPVHYWVIPVSAIPATQKILKIGKRSKWNEFQTRGDTLVTTIIRESVE